MIQVSFWKPAVKWHMQHRLRKLYMYGFKLSFICRMALILSQFTLLELRNIWFSERPLWPSSAPRFTPVQNESEAYIYGERSETFSKATMICIFHFISFLILSIRFYFFFYHMYCSSYLSFPVRRCFYTFRAPTGPFQAPAKADKLCAFFYFFISFEDFEHSQIFFPKK